MPMFLLIGESNKSCIAVNPQPMRRGSVHSLPAPIPYLPPPIARSRRATVAVVLASLIDHVNHRRRVLVGFDFPYGYPAGWCRAIGLESGRQAAWLTIWRDLSRRIEDNAGNHNNRFRVAHDLNAIAGQGVPGPFWGCPQARATPNLQPTSPGFPFSAANDVILPRLRIAKTRLRGVLGQDSWFWLCRATVIKHCYPWFGRDSSAVSTGQPPLLDHPSAVYSQVPPPPSNCLLNATKTDHDQN
jgi:hypothetical protein